jgi:hypothetical protein
MVWFDREVLLGIQRNDPEITKLNVNLQNDVADVSTPMKLERRSKTTLFIEDLCLIHGGNVEFCRPLICEDNKASNIGK